MSSMNDPQVQLAARAYAKMQYEQEQVRASGASSLDAIGAPTWSREAWDAFKAQYGRYPSIHEGDLPSMEGAPIWAYELQGLRPPPKGIGVTMGSSGATPTSADHSRVFRGSR